MTSTPPPLPLRPDLRTDAAAVRVQKRPEAVQVHFAEAAGSLVTREGLVRYEKGDAILTGSAGDIWPVSRTQFLVNYRPREGTVAGADGTYSKRSMVVLARQLTQVFTVKVGYHDDPITGEPGDWLVQYAQGNYGIVGREIFEATYNVLGLASSPRAAGGRSGAYLRWVGGVPAYLYLGFLKVLSLGLGKPVAHDAGSSAADLIPPEVYREFDGLPGEEVDAAATLAGEVYRGIGIAVGALGVLVVLAALAPNAFDLSEGAISKLGGAKVALMLLISVLIAATRLSGLKARWIGIRLLAEQLRYQELALAREEANTGNLAFYARLRYSLIQALDGSQGQIQYNKKRRDRFERIEVCVQRITYWGFGISLGAALVPKLCDFPLLPEILPCSHGMHYKQLLLLTAFLPAALGALHGVLGFLKLSELVTEHERMVVVLERLLQDLPPPQPGPGDMERLVVLADEVQQILSGGERAWTGIAWKQTVLPP